MNTQKQITNECEQTQPIQPVQNKPSEVTPWKVIGNVDYRQLIEQFGTEEISPVLLERFERLTKKPLHPWLRRGMFFSHRHLNEILDSYENGYPIFLYTGRGPSNDMHIGHLIPFFFTQYLQSVFDCPLVIQISDEEKYYFKQLTFETVYKLGFENSKDIIAAGFDPKKTFIFSNRDYRINVPSFETFVAEMKKLVTVGTMEKIFGFDKNANIGQAEWGLYQSAPAFYQAFPHIFSGKPAHCLVAYAIDQDPYFRLARDLASDMGLIKPCSIMCKFLPPLTGSDGGKMSSSVSSDSTLFLNDDENTTRKKIIKYAFSGGRDTLEEHRKLGGNPDIDVAYQYLMYFENDDNILKQIYDDFKSGKMTSIEIKNIMADKIVSIIKNHQQKRSLVTKEIVEEFYKMKSMVVPEYVQKPLIDEEIKLATVLSQHGIKYERYCYRQIINIDDELEYAKLINGIACETIPLICDGKSYVYITKVDKQLNMKQTIKKIGETFGFKKIKFYEKKVISDLFKIDSSLFSILSIINDTSKQFDVILDNNLISSNLYFRSFRNDGSIKLSCSDIQQLMKQLNINIKLI